MKKKKFNIFEKLIFTILFGISSVCLLGGWTIDNNGNLQSDNLFNVNNYDNQSNSTVINNTYININTTDNTNSDFKVQLVNNNVVSQMLMTAIISSGYKSATFTKTSNDIQLKLALSGNVQDGAIYYDISNLQNNTIYTISLELYYYTSNNYDIKNIMLNSGSTALPYEPYGTWYSQTNYENLENEISLLTRQVEVLEEQIDGLQASLEQVQQEYEDYQDLINNTVGTIAYDISQYNVSVGSVPNPPSFEYTKHQDLITNFSNIGYLNISNIYTNYIQNGNNNSIYITTPQSNLMTFDLIFNYIGAPSTMLKTTLTLPNGTLQQFSYSVDNFQYNEDWTLANLVGSTTIGENFNLNEISYKDLLITYESEHNTLSEIKIGSNNGFNIGFNSGYNSALNRINEIQQELNTKTSLLEKSQIDLQNKTNEYNMLLARYQQVTETPLQLNFQNLIWTIASSPFESFKQIWNVDILGFNIANFVIGVMSVFVVMYIIKKIF